MSSPDVHTLADTIVAICWGLFVLVWIVGALYNARRGPEVKRRTRGSYLWLAVGVGAWLVLKAIPNTDWHSLDTGSPWVRAVGMALLVGSTAFTLWARLELGTMWSSSAVEKEDHELRTDGPYAITRHPIYTGIVGMLLGTALAVGLGVWTAAFVLGLVVVEVKIHSEERLLNEVFPGTYEQYRRRVPQLIPGLQLLHGKRS